MVLYRKYRPQTLDEVIGQTLVKQSLQTAISLGKLAHAYLFYGPRGTGKTSTARILAKMVNCEGGGSLLENSSTRENEKTSIEGRTPCNQCSTCISITDGSNLDVVEMDAASNRGIEDIRLLRDSIKLSPTSARKKVYIIDEVHMLSNDAFNALLKTLEEPPEHVLFVLATTELQKIPQTILSRVTKLDFKSATAEELTEALERVVKEEKIKIDKAAILTLAKKAQGSFRDGIKLLDLLSGLEEIDQNTVEKFLQGGVFEGVVSILKEITAHDASLALKRFSSEMETGVNVKELTLTILDVLRQLLLIKHGLGEQLVSPETDQEKFKELKSLAEKFDMFSLVRTIEAFQKSFEQGRYSSIATLPLELAIVESCGVKEEPKSQRVSRACDLTIFKESNENSDSSEPKVNDDSSRLTEIPIIAVPAENASEDMQKISERWNYILETVRASNFSLEALLRSSKIVKCEGKSVVLEVPYAFHQRIIEAPKARDLLESIFTDILQRKVIVSTALGKRTVKNNDLANIEVAADDEIVKIAAEIFSSESIN